MYHLLVSFTDKALSESNFVHVRLSFRRNPFARLYKAVRNVTSAILRHTGLSMEGRKILIRTTPSKTKGHGTFFCNSTFVPPNEIKTIV